MSARRCTSLSYFLVCAGACLAWSAPSLHAQADFKVDVNLVMLHVTVTDHGSKFIRDIPQRDFRITEDGRPQQITVFRQEDAPVAVGLVVDNSGSMRSKLPDVVAAATAFARSSNPRDDMFVVNFNESVSLGLPAGDDFVSDPDKLHTALLQIHARGQTALYDALASGLEHLRHSPLDKKVLIVVSDGGDNASSHALSGVLTSLQASDVIVYAVGLFDDYDEDRNPGVLRRMARLSGGEAFFPREIPAVTGVLQAISRDIRNQYTIGYVPSNTRRDGEYRAVSVKIAEPRADRWTVRTRAGYVALKGADQ